MPFSPKNTKYRKQHKMKNTGIAQCGHVPVWGEWGLQAITRGRLTDKQIEAGRRTINRNIKHQGKLFIRVMADKPFTDKGPEVKMGKGKGAFSYWGLYVQPGKIIYEIQGTSEALARFSLLKCATKMPFKVKVVQRPNDIKDPS
jgi:large subunit ribosomal protein L16